jgi:uncharacterized protein (DUF2164 family)
MRGAIKYMKDNNDDIELTNEKRADMIVEIQQYFLDKRDEELSNLAAGKILNFFIENLATEFYNQGVYDSYKYMNSRVEDILSIQKY